MKNAIHQVFGACRWCLDPFDWLKIFYFWLNILLQYKHHKMWKKKNIYIYIYIFIERERERAREREREREVKIEKRERKELFVRGGEFTRNEGDSRS